MPGDQPPLSDNAAVTNAPEPRAPNLVEGSTECLGATTVDAVAEVVLSVDRQGSRFGCAIRESIDQVLDGQRTRRWNYDQLHKTEKTHLGTIIEINVHRAFRFADGIEMDYLIAGVDVDCKFSRSLGGWQIPVEALGHVCLVVWADDAAGRWSAGLVRVTEDRLRPGRNRDLKRVLNDDGLRQIRWLWRDQPLLENLLLHLDPETRNRILTVSGRDSGQKRIDALFRLVQGRIISRTTVLTVGQQDDAPKRARDARRHLRAEGIIVLGHQGDHPRIAARLGLPIPKKGEWISARLAASDGPGAFSIGGRLFRRALEGDPCVPAPPLNARLAEDE